jgi:hypothetical protein
MALTFYTLQIQVIMKTCDGEIIILAHRHGNPVTRQLLVEGLSPYIDFRSRGAEMLHRGGRNDRQEEVIALEAEVDWDGLQQASSCTQCPRASLLPLSSHR